MNAPALHARVATLAFVLLSGCASATSRPDGADSAAPSVGAQLILARSSPADGSTVAGAVSALQLHFSQRVRLAELTVTGPGGAMPMMITPAGEVADYTLPLPDLGAGNYRVEWRAVAAEHEYRGAFSFTVR